MKYDRFDENALRYMIINFGILTRFDGELPDALNNDQYRVAIKELAEIDESGINKFKKVHLRQLAPAVGVALQGNESTRDLREAIGRRCDFEYQSPSNQIRTFNKLELKRIALKLAEIEYKEGDQRVVEDSEQAGSIIDRLLR